MQPEEPTDLTPFARRVREVLDSHKATYRSQRIRTGIPHSTVVNWVQGVPPTMEGVLKFARGFDLDESELLELAGHQAIDERESAGGRRYREGLAQLYREFGPGGRELFPLENHPPLKVITVEQADAEIAWLRKVSEVALRESDAAGSVQGTIPGASATATPDSPPTDRTGWHKFTQGIRDLKQEYGRPVPLDFSDRDPDELMAMTVEEAEAELERRRWLMEATEQPTGYRLFVEGLAALAEELGRPVPVTLLVKQAQAMTPESARETLDTLRRQAEAGLW